MTSRPLLTLPWEDILSDTRPLSLDKQNINLVMRRLQECGLADPGTQHVVAVALEILSMPAFSPVRWRWGSDMASDVYMEPWWRNETAPMPSIEIATSFPELAENLRASEHPAVYLRYHFYRRCFQVAHVPLPDGWVELQPRGLADYTRQLNELRHHLLRVARDPAERPMYLHRLVCFFMLERATTFSMSHPTDMSIRERCTAQGLCPIIQLCAYAISCSVFHRRNYGAYVENGEVVFSDTPANMMEFDFQELMDLIHVGILCYAYEDEETTPEQAATLFQLGLRLVMVYMLSSTSPSLGMDMEGVEPEIRERAIELNRLLSEGVHFTCCRFVVDKVITHILPVVLVRLPSDRPDDLSRDSIQTPWVNEPQWTIRGTVDRFFLHVLEHNVPIDVILAYNAKSLETAMDEDADDIPRRAVPRGRGGGRRGGRGTAQQSRPLYPGFTRPKTYEGMTRSKVMEALRELLDHHAIILPDGEADPRASSACNAIRERWESYRRNSGLALTPTTDVARIHPSDKVTLLQEYYHYLRRDCTLQAPAIGRRHAFFLIQIYRLATGRHMRAVPDWDHAVLLDARLSDDEDESWLLVVAQEDSEEDREKPKCANLLLHYEYQKQIFREALTRNGLVIARFLDWMQADYPAWAETAPEDVRGRIRRAARDEFVARRAFYRHSCITTTRHVVRQSDEAFLRRLMQE